MLHMSGDGATEGFRAEEVIYFSFGSYSDYCVSTVVIVDRDVPVAEIEAVVGAMRTRYNDEVRRVHAYKWHGDFVDAMVERGAFRKPNVREAHTDCEVRGYSGSGMLCLSMTDRSE